MRDLPRVRAERKLPVLERAPPPAVFAYVPGLTQAADVRAFMDRGEARPPAPGPAPFPLYMSRKVFRGIVEQAERDAREERETMGLLAGTLYRAAGETYGVVKDAVTGGLVADAVSVRFSREREGLADALDALPYEWVLLGWWHSHPGYSCFLSPTDLDTSTRMFAAPHHRAVVCDPIERDLRSFKVENGRAVDTPWAVHEDKEGPR